MNPKASKRPRRTGREVSGKPKHKDELELMKQLKSHMTRRQWDDMLKLLNLFNAHILSPPQLIQSARDLFGKQPELHESFYQFLVMFCGGATMFNAEREKGEMDLGPSYSLVSGNVALTPISRDSVANEVLNNEMILPPKHKCRLTKKENESEIELRRVEDERYELDMFIENINGAVEALSPIMEEIGTLPVEVQRTFSLGENLTTLQIRTIERLYGEKEGYMLVNALYESPGAVIPVVIERLRQRLKLFTEARDQLLSYWEGVATEHRVGALDVSSAIQTALDEERFSPDSNYFETAVVKDGGIKCNYFCLSDEDQGLLSLLSKVCSGEAAAASKKVFSSLLEPFFLKSGASEEMSAVAERRVLINKETAALFSIHSEIHRRLGGLKVAIAKAEAEGKGKNLWDAVLSKAADSCKPDFDKWIYKKIGYDAYTFVGIGNLIQSFSTRAVKVAAAEDWAAILSMKEGEELSARQASLGEEAIQVVYDIGSGVAVMSVAKKAQVVVEEKVKAEENLETSVPAPTATLQQAAAGLAPVVAPGAALGSAPAPAPVSASQGGAAPQAQQAPVVPPAQGVAPGAAPTQAPAPVEATPASESAVTAVEASPMEGVVVEGGVAAPVGGGVPKVPSEGEAAGGFDPLL